MTKCTLFAKIKYEGKVFQLDNGRSVEVLEYLDNNNIRIRFVETGGERWTTVRSVKRGIVRDYLSPSVCGVGILGEGFNKGEAYSREYKLWTHMLSRCYSELFLGKNPCYEKVTVSDNFKNYQFFKTWCRDQVGFDQHGWDLDKDILSQDNKIYSEDTCCFVPKEVNLLLTYEKGHNNMLPFGVYFSEKRKKYMAQMSINNSVTYIGCFDCVEDAAKAYNLHKEERIKQVAEKWRGLLDSRVYNKLVNWEVGSIE